MAQRKWAVYLVTYKMLGGPVKTGYCEAFHKAELDGTRRVRWIYSHADIVNSLGGTSAANRADVNRLLSSMSFRKAADYAYTDDAQFFAPGTIFKRISADKINPNFQLSLSECTLQVRLPSEDVTPGSDSLDLNSKAQAESSEGEDRHQGGGGDVGDVGDVGVGGGSQRQDLRVDEQKPAGEGIKGDRSTSKKRLLSHRAEQKSVVEKKPRLRVQQPLDLQTLQGPKDGEESDEEPSRVRFRRGRTRRRVRIQDEEEDEDKAKDTCNKKRERVDAIAGATGATISETTCKDCDRKEDVDESDAKTRVSSQTSKEHRARAPITRTIEGVDVEQNSRFEAKLASLAPRINRLEAQRGDKHQKAHDDEEAAAEEKDKTSHDSEEDKLAAEEEDGVEEKEEYEEEEENEDEDDEYDEDQEDAEDAKVEERRLDEESRATQGWNLRNFKEAFCARPSRFYHTLAGKFLLDRLQRYCTFGSGGAPTKHMRAFFFDNPHGAVTRTWTQTSLEYAETGRCTLCESTRHLSCSISVAVGGVTLAGKVGIECLKRANALSHIVNTIALELEQFPRTDHAATAAMNRIFESHTQLDAVHCRLRE